MSETLEFDEAGARKQEATYETPEAAERREHARALLDPKPGERVLSIGCGPGFEPAEIAPVVGADGHVHGIDRSPAMLALAADRCASHSQISLSRGDAGALPVTDGAVDAAVAVQVYEYLDAVEPALAELARVLRPGGRAVVCDADFESLILRSGDRERTERVLDAFDDHCPHPRLGSRLGPLVRDAGLAVERVEPHSMLVTDLEGSFADHMLESVAAYATGQGTVDRETARAWVEDVRERDAAGDTFFDYTQYLYLVRTPE